MASQEEGEEVRESNEGMTNFEPYVAGKVRVSLSMVSYGREGKHRVPGVQKQQQQSVASRARGDSYRPRDPEQGGISTAKGLFRKIRSSLSTAASGPPQPPPSRSSLAASSRTSKRPAVATRQGQHPHQQLQQQAARKQPRLTNPPPPSKVAPHHASAPVLHKPTSAGPPMRSSPSSRATSPPRRAGGGGLSPPRGGSPSVIEDMASYGPGSGRRNRPPAPPTSTNREQGLSVQSEQQRSKSEEPPPSPQLAELEPPRALDDNSKALSSVQSSSGDAHHITLMSYSDVQRHRAAKAAAKVAAASGSGSGGGTMSTSMGGTLLPPGVKQQLNKQDVLKRIGSIENDEVSKIIYDCLILCYSS